jgi:CheY-like chemotaxis protein
MPKTLLLADDSVTIQRVIELTFAHEDVRVVSVSDGRRAVQWIDAERPDIVLVDVEVPEVDGYAVATHIKSSPSLKHIPVVLLAGAFEPVDENKAREAGCDDILVKPFEPQQLISRVRDLLDRSRNGAMPPGEQAARAAGGRATVPAEPAPVATFPASKISGRPAAPASLETPPLPELPVEISPEPLLPPTRPIWEVGLPVEMTPVPTPAAPPPAASAKVSLVNAFTALLAAEQSSQPIRSPESSVTMNDAAVEAAVRRVLTRMTDDAVRRIVTETAERLIREEIEKIKADPE